MFWRKTITQELIIGPFSLEDLLKVKLNVCHVHFSLIFWRLFVHGGRCVACFLKAGYSSHLWSGWVCFFCQEMEVIVCVTENAAVIHMHAYVIRSHAFLGLQNKLVVKTFCFLVGFWGFFQSSIRRNLRVFWCILIIMLKVFILMICSHIITFRCSNKQLISMSSQTYTSVMTS